MLTKKVVSLLFLLTSSFSLNAMIRPSPCEFSFTGEWIYFHPLIDNPYYAIKSASSIPQGRRVANELSFHSGFRLQGMYGFDCYKDLRLAWTSLCTSDKDSAFSPFLKPTQGYPDNTPNTITNGTGRSKIDFDFDRVEGLFGLHVFNCACATLTLEVGAQYSSIDQTKRLAYSNESTLATDTTKSCYWGIGPQIGVDGSYQICQGLALVGTASSALLVGESDNKSRIIVNGELFPNVRNETIYRIVPNLGMRLGFNYNLCICNKMWNLEGGYEFLSYLRAIDGLIFPDDILAGETIDYYTNVSFHGPYISLTLRY